MLSKINYTFVTLIPKQSNPREMSHFRPISLCNVIYKISSKVLTNRLKLVLPSLISHHQGAFVPGCMISDNTILATEIANFLFKFKRGKKGFMDLKLHISKAYDRVDWVFLRGVMATMGFPSNWINLLMQCVSTMPYFFLVNGSPCGYLRSKRGLRQGDPLFP